MACTGKPGYEHLTDFEFVDAIVCTFGNQMGVAVFSMMVFGTIIISIYATTNDIRIPAVLIFLTGGIVIPQVASPAIAFATLIILMTGAGAMTLLYYKFSR